jgi:photosystem II stability/assembly factor-like uncharacterized protein
MRLTTLSLALIALPSLLHAQWQPQASNTDAELRGLSVVSPRVVWASGTKGRVVHTTNGGTTWRVDTVPGADSLDFRDVYALDARTAWVMSSGDADKGQARIYRTSDGGRSWTLAFTTDRKGVFLDALAMWDARHGIAQSDPVDGKLFLLETSDGAHWTRIPPDRLPPTLAGEAAFAASGTCLTTFGASHVWIATGGGAIARVFHSPDRGKTWTVAPTPVHAGGASSGIFSVAFRDARHGIVVGGDYQQPTASLPNVALTDDGGATWRRAKGPLPGGYMSAVAWLPGAPRSLVAVGLAGTARSADGGESWAMIDATPYNAVAFASPDAGWAVGPRGRIARWTPAPSGKR